MSDAPASLPHLLSGSRRCRTAGHPITRPVLLRSQFAPPLRPSHAALMLARKLIEPTDKRDPRATGSHLITDAAGLTPKSP